MLLSLLLRHTETMNLGPSINTHGVLYIISDVKDPGVLPLTKYGPAEAQCNNFSPYTYIHMGQDPFLHLSPMQLCLVKLVKKKNTFIKKVFKKFHTNIYYMLGLSPHTFSTYKGKHLTLVFIEYLTWNKSVHFLLLPSTSVKWINNYVTRTFEGR